MRTKSWLSVLLGLSLGGLGTLQAAWAVTPTELLTGYAQQAGAPPSVQQGQQFFNARHGGQWRCAACHMAYPPGMLPASSWQAIMTSLPKHYGSDASLDAASVSKLSAWLMANAAPVSARPAQDRITRAGWFVREHDEIAPSVWQRASIKSAANCMACHAGAEQGDFNEHRVRIPR